LSPNNPLLKMENVTLTPHIASSAIEAVEETYRGGVKNMIAYLEGRRPNWMVNPAAYKRSL